MNNYERIKNMSVEEMAKCIVNIIKGGLIYIGINKTTIRERLRAGWTDTEALTTPIRKRTCGYRPSVNCGAKIDLE